MLNSGMPLMTVLIAWLAFGTLTRADCSVCSSDSSASSSSHCPKPRLQTNAAGVVLVLVAVSSYGVAVNLAGLNAHGSLPVISRALGVATLICVPFGVVDGSQSSFSWGSLAACAAVGIGGTGIAYAFAGWLTGRVGAADVDRDLCDPAVSIVLGVVFRDETVSAWAIAGTIIVLTGAFLSSRVD